MRADRGPHFRGPLSGRAGCGRPARQAGCCEPSARRASSRSCPPASTLWLLYSNTKVVTAAAIWTLVEDGRCVLDPVAHHVPEFARLGRATSPCCNSYPSGRLSLGHGAGAPGRITRCCASTSATSRWNGRRGAGALPRPRPIGPAVLIEACRGDFRDFSATRVIARLGLGTSSSSACRIRIWADGDDARPAGKGQAPRQMENTDGAWPAFPAAAASGRPGHGGLLPGAAERRGVEVRSCRGA